MSFLFTELLVINYNSKNNNLTMCLKLNIIISCFYNKKKKERKAFIDLILHVIMKVIK